MDSFSEDYCELCDLLHGGKSDASHKSIHRKMKAATKYLNYIPATYEKREQYKSEGWNLFHKSPLLEEKIQGALEVIKAYYDRSLYYAINQGFIKKHPNFRDFIACLDLNHLFSKSEVVEELYKHFGNSTYKMDPGTTYWVPKGK